MENNLDNILNPKEGKKGLIKKESDEYEKMISGEWKKEFFPKPESMRILDFYPLSDEPHPTSESEDMVVYAADSIASDEEIETQTFFYNTKNDEFVLLINNKKDSGVNKVYASLIDSNDSDNFGITLLYCSGIDKYFIIDNANEVFIGNFPDESYKSFKFSLMFPKAFLTIMVNENRKDEYEINAVTKNEVFQGAEILKSNKKYIIKFNADEKINAAVFSNKSYSDFLILQDNSIILPENLPVNKSRIFIF